MSRPVQPSTAATDSQSQDVVDALQHYAHVLEQRDVVLRRRLGAMRLAWVAETRRTRKILCLEAFRAWRTGTSLASVAVPFNYVNHGGNSGADVSSLQRQLQQKTLLCETLEDDLKRSVAVTSGLVHALQSAQHTHGSPSPLLLPRPASATSFSTALLESCTREAVVSIDDPSNPLASKNAIIHGLQQLARKLTDTVTEQNARIDKDDTMVTRHAETLGKYKEEILYAQAALQHQIDVCLEIAIQLGSANSAISKHQLIVDNTFSQALDLYHASSDRSITSADIQRLLDGLQPYVSTETLSGATLPNNRPTGNNNNNDGVLEEESRVAALEAKIKDLQQQVADAEGEVGQRGEHIDMLSDRVTFLESALEYSQAEVWRLTEEVVEKMTTLAAAKSCCRQYELKVSQLAGRCDAYSALLGSLAVPDLPPLVEIDTSLTASTPDEEEESQEGDTSCLGSSEVVVRGGVTSLEKILADTTLTSSSEHFQALRSMTDVGTKVDALPPQNGANNSLWESRLGPTLPSIMEENGLQSPDSVDGHVFDS